LPELLAFNERILRSFQVPLQQIDFRRACGVTAYQIQSTGGSLPVILLPKDVLRELPVAYDWEQCLRRRCEECALAAKTNSLIGEIWKGEDAQTEEERA